MVLLTAKVFQNARHFWCNVGARLRRGRDTSGTRPEHDLNPVFLDRIWPFQRLAPDSTEKKSRTAG
jgi:hypothetical protein